MSFSVFFWGCRKDIANFTPSVYTDNATPKPNPLTPNMAKDWFESEFGKSKTISPPTSFSGDSSANGYYFNQTFQITPAWTQAEISTYLSVYPIVIVPVQPIAFLDAKHQYYSLVVFRDSVNQITARLQVYDVMPQYDATHTAFDVSNFSGIFYQICLNGKVQRVFAVENGQFKKTFTLTPNATFGRVVATTRGICVNACEGQRPSFIDYIVCGFCSLFGGEGTSDNASGGGDVSFDFGPGISATGSTNNSGGGALGSLNVNGQINNSLFTATQLNQIRTQFYAHGLEDVFETLKTNQTQLNMVNNYLKRNDFNQASIDLVNLHTELMTEDARYRQENVNTPTLGTDAWVDAMWTIREPGWNSLNAEEKSLCKWHPLEALQYRKESLKAISEAQALGFRRFPLTGNSVDGNDRNQVNAFQHAYWNALLTLNIGSARAKVWTDAHESRLPNTPDMNFATAMDLFNNAIGRNIGEIALGNPPGYAGNLSQTVENWVNLGYMKYVCFDSYIPTQANKDNGTTYTNQRLKFTNQTCQ